MHIGETLQATLKHVSDGDTILVQETPKPIRLAFIDTPEKTQQYGANAKNALANFLDAAHREPGSIIVEAVQELDQYGRIVAIIHHNGRNINLQMIQEGHAWCYRSIHPPQIYKDAEDEARREKRGLWASEETCAQAPWEYRKMMKMGVYHTTGTHEAPGQHGQPHS